MTSRCRSSKYESVEGTKAPTTSEGQIAGGKELGAGVDLDKADVQAYSDHLHLLLWWRGVL